jgi:hypothetical protein
MEVYRVDNRIQKKKWIGSVRQDGLMQVAETLRHRKNFSIAFGLNMD